LTLVNSLMSLPLFEWAHFSFMRNALVAILIVTPLFAFMGCMIVNNQMAFFSDCIGHSALSGIAIGALIGIADPIWSMLVFSAALAIGVTLLRHYGSASSDSVIGIVMSFTVALGIVILSRGGGFNKYSRFLIGDILSITQTEILCLIAVAIIFIVLWLVYFNRIFLVSINTSLARSRRMSVWTIQGLFAVITALIVTISIQWIGILVINAMLILPASAARNMTKTTAGYLWLAAGINVISGISGLAASYYLSTATGATIVLFAMAFYMLSLVIKKFR
jgi:zinc transport system permease protein